VNIGVYVLQQVVDIRGVNAHLQRVAKMIAFVSKMKEIVIPYFAIDALDLIKKEIALTPLLLTINQRD
jgi:hypothetical protein